MVAGRHQVTESSYAYVVCVVAMRSLSGKEGDA